MKKILFAIFTILVCVLFAGCEKEKHADFTYYDNVTYVEFTNISSDGFDAYSWEFGDGTSEEKSSPSSLNTIRHTYKEPGVYNVRMKVSHHLTNETLSCIKEVRVRM